MIKYNSIFTNYEEFKNIFGMVKHGNNVVSRKNLILLQSIKHNKFLNMVQNTSGLRKDILQSSDYLCQIVDYFLSKISGNMFNHKNNIKLYDFPYLLSSELYSTDENKGICTDGDTNAIRYINRKTDKVFKMKSGKFIRKLIFECGLNEYLPEQLITYYCEKFAEKWQANNPLKESYELVVSDKLDDFRKIYDSNCLVGNFGSCMVDEDYYYFYSDAVDASAAYLTDYNGGIVARCIIFNNVTDDATGKVYRLAERQYSSDSDLILQRLLINKLIENDYIDGYKEVGSSCHDNRNYIANNGDSLRECKFSINCNLEYDSTVSYQDSFKYFSYDRQRAYNYSSANYYSDTLDITNGRLESEYDDYHDEYCREVVEVYVHGQSMYCNVDKLDDFIQIGYNYYHCEDCVECAECGEWCLLDESYYSELTDGEYCCENCMLDAEYEYKRDNWKEDAFTDEFIDPDNRDTVKIQFANDSKIYFADINNVPENYEYNAETGIYIEMIEA